MGLGQVRILLVLSFGMIHNQYKKNTQLKTLSEEKKMGLHKYKNTKKYKIDFWLKQN